jgi:hypothetical protein
MCDPMRNAARATSTWFVGIAESPDFTAIPTRVKPVTETKLWSRLAVEAGCEELFQPRGEDDDSHAILQTDLSKHFRVFVPDAESVGHKMLVKGRTPSNVHPIPLVKRIHWCSVRLDEIHMGGRNRDLEELSAEMGHGRGAHQRG